MISKFLVFIENRTEDVKISLLVDGMPIKDAAGNIWNQKSFLLLRAQNSDAELPYEKDFSGAAAITWKGELDSGKLEGGPHTLKVLVWDTEGVPNKAPDLDNDHDNVVDTEVEVIIGGLNAHTVGALYENFTGVSVSNPSTLERNQTIYFTNENVGIASVKIDGPQGTIWNPTFDPPVSSTSAVLSDLPIGDYTVQSFSAVGAETRTPFIGNYLFSLVGNHTIALSQRLTAKPVNAKTATNGEKDLLCTSR